MFDRRHVGVFLAVQSRPPRLIVGWGRRAENVRHAASNRRGLLEGWRRTARLLTGVGTCTRPDRAAALLGALWCRHARHRNRRASENRGTEAVSTSWSRAIC